jgi:hypothetical protein
MIELTLQKANIVNYKRQPLHILHFSISQVQYDFEVALFWFITLPPIWKQIFAI